MSPPVVVQYKKKLKRLVAHGQLRLALDELERFFTFIEVEEAEDELMLISGQLERTETAYRMGTISREDYLLEINGISSKLFSFLNHFIPSKTVQVRGTN